MTIITLINEVSFLLRISGTVYDFLVNVCLLQRYQLLLRYARKRWAIWKTQYIFA